MIKFIWLFAF
jgi:capsular polysaccharide export protein